MKTTNCETSVRQKMLDRLGLTETENESAATSAGRACGLSQTEQIRLELLRQYNQKPIRDLFQLDALITRQTEAGITHGSSGTTDEDGDCINCERKLELRNTGADTVRIQVPVGVQRLEAARVLRKAAEWIESRDEVLSPQLWEGLGRDRKTILNRCAAAEKLLGESSNQQQSTKESPWFEDVIVDVYDRTAEGIVEIPSDADFVVIGRLTDSLDCRVTVILERAVKTLPDVERLLTDLRKSYPDVHSFTVRGNDKDPRFVELVNNLGLVRGSIWDRLHDEIGD